MQTQHLAISPVPHTCPGCPAVPQGHFSAGQALAEHELFVCTPVPSLEQGSAKCKASDLLLPCYKGTEGQ